MTGELTLKGDILPIGGLNEKTVAALRAASGKSSSPRSSQLIKELPKEVRAGLKIHTAETFRDVLKIAAEKPMPRSGTSATSRGRPSTRRRQQQELLRIHRSPRHTTELVAVGGSPAGRVPGASWEHVVAGAHR